MQQKVSVRVGVLIIIIMALTAGAFIYKVDKYDMENLYQPVKNQIKSKKKDKVACTMEAKLCSDGTYVSRSGPNCEFAACPGESAVDTSDWQTYRNDEYGFEFKYPGDLKYKAEESYPVVYFYNTSASEFAHLDFISDIKIIFSNEISLFYCADDSNEKSYVEINRNKFKSCVVEPDTEGGPIMRAYIPNNSNFAILFAQDTSISNKTSQILSTFQFTN